MATRKTSSTPSKTAQRTVPAPRHPMSALRSQMDQIFENFFDDWGLPQWGTGVPAERMFPRIDMTEDDKNVVVVADLPGVDEKNIDLSLENGVLTLKAERKSESEEGGDDKKFHRIERSYGSAQRSFRLPCDVVEDKVAAKFEKGVLTVTLPKAAPAKPKSKRIQVKSG